MLTQSNTANTPAGLTLQARQPDSEVCTQDLQGPYPAPWLDIHGCGGWSVTYGLGSFGTGYLAGEGSGYRRWQPTGHQGWWGASLLAPAPVPGGIHQVHVNTSHGQLNHLSVSGLQSQRERPPREEGGGRYRTPSGGNDLSPVQVGSAGASLGGRG